MCRKFGSDRAWAEKIIEEQHKHSPAHAYYMCRDCGSSREWAEKIIEEQKDNYYTYLMFHDC